MRTLAVIPARGGSKGVPRKNLRPLLGRPLIAYAVEAALAASSVDDVVVTTEDDEIALFAERFGARSVARPQDLSADDVPLDPVIAHAVLAVEERGGAPIDVVVTVQPTSPLVRGEDIDEAVRILHDRQVETVMSVVEDRNLRWIREDGAFRPLWSERVNRPLLPDVYRETGAVVVCTRDTLERLGTRIGARIWLAPMAPERAIYVDSHTDFFVCEALLRRRRVVFAVVGHPEVGLGHGYRGVTLAHEFVDHEVVFVCEEGEDLAAELIATHNYECVRAPRGELAATILRLRPDVVVSDVLDTDGEYVRTLRDAGVATVNFEDLGVGAELADLVVNALYPARLPGPQVVSGPAWFCLRDEFLHAPPQRPIGAVERVLLTFGGADEGRITTRLARLLRPHLDRAGVHVDVVTGPGFTDRDGLLAETARYEHAEVSVTHTTPRISEHMAAADVALTSGGRTVFELAALGIPTIVLCQNVRELSHTFASAKNGVVNLGLHAHVDDAEVVETFLRVAGDPSMRTLMRERMEAADLRGGKRRVVEAIRRHLEQGHDATHS